MCFAVMIAVLAITSLMLWIPFPPVNLLAPLVGIVGLYIYIVRDAARRGRSVGSAFIPKLSARWPVYVLLLLAALTIQAWGIRPAM